MGIFPPFPPLAKIGVLFSYSTGAVTGIAINIFKRHDINLARELTKYLEIGNLLLGDRAYECIFGYMFMDKKRG